MKGSLLHPFISSLFISAGQRVHFVPIKEIVQHCCVGGRVGQAAAARGSVRPPPPPPPSPSQPASLLQSPSEYQLGNLLSFLWNKYSYVKENNVQIIIFYNTKYCHDRPHISCLLKIEEVEETWDGLSSTKDGNGFSFSILAYGPLWPLNTQHMFINQESNATPDIIKLKVCELDKKLCSISAAAAVFISPPLQCRPVWPLESNISKY